MAQHDRLLLDKMNSIIHLMNGCGIDVGEKKESNEIREINNQIISAKKAIREYLREFSRKLLEENKTYVGEQNCVSE